MGIDEWLSATQGPVLWPLLNVVTGRQMFHGHRWTKCYPGTSPIAITECCDWETDVPWASMNEVLPRDQSYRHYWMLWLGDRCPMGIDEWSATQGPVWLGRQMFYGHRWMKYCPSTSHMAITECCDLMIDVPWASMNEVLHEIQYRHPPPTPMHHTSAYTRLCCAICVNSSMQKHDSKK
jgi:hypothetical protein